MVVGEILHLTMILPGAFSSQATQAVEMPNSHHGNRSLFPSPISAQSSLAGVLALDQHSSQDSGSMSASLECFIFSSIVSILGGIGVPLVQD